MQALQALCRLRKSIALPPSENSLAVIASLLIDHVSQLPPLQTFCEQAGFPAGAFLKVDTGYHRAGLPPNILNTDHLVKKLSQLHTEGLANFVGLYSHSSLSYDNSTSPEAVAALIVEINGCLDALHENIALLPNDRPLVLSVGPSPQVTAIQNAVVSSSPESKNLRQLLSRLATKEVDGLGVSLELHAGVYSIMDMQQISTHSVDSMGEFNQEIALTVIAEVVSVYSDGERAKPEALVAAGTLAFGREPCHSYAGWGAVEPEEHTEGDSTPGRLIVESVRIYPNHACVTGAMYDRYYVVDSSDVLNGQRVTDVWVRARGW